MFAGSLTNQTRLAFRSFFVGLLCLATIGCGQVGPLYLPEDGMPSQTESQSEPERPNPAAEQDNDPADTNEDGNAP